MAKEHTTNGVHIGKTEFTISWLVDLLKKASPENDDDSIELKQFTYDDITGGVGFLSTIYRVNLTWNKSTSNLPNSIILKVPGIANADSHFSKLPWTEEETTVMAQMKEKETIEERLGFVIAMHRNEIKFYELFGGDEAAIPLPRFYFGRDYDPVHESDGVIVMEDLSRRTALAQFADGLNIKQVEAVVEQLAALHVQSMASSDWHDKFHEDKEMAEKGAGFMKSVASMLTRVKPEWFSELYEKVVHMYSHDYIAKSVSSFTSIGIPPVIIHGDLWTSNLLWNINEKKEAGNELLAIIDWQMAHPGNCCEDIARLLVSSISGPLRRQHTDHVLQVYHKKLVECNKGVAPFTLDQVREAYKAIYPYAVIVLLFGVPMYINIDAIVDGPTKSERQENLLLRARHALEDAIELLGL